MAGVGGSMGETLDSVIATIITELRKPMGYADSVKLDAAAKSVGEMVGIEKVSGVNKRDMQMIAWLEAEHRRSADAAIGVIEEAASMCRNPALSSVSKIHALEAVIDALDGLGYGEGWT